MSLEDFSKRSKKYIHIFGWKVCLIWVLLVKGSLDAVERSSRSQKFILVLKLEFSFHICWLRNRSSLAVICWVINRCLEVSCKVDQITITECKWFIYLQLTDKLWFITQQITHKSWSILILTHRKQWKSNNCILQILPTFPHRIKKPREQFWL